MWMDPRNKGLNLCIWVTPEGVLLQTVKTQMKCRIINAAFHQGLHCLLRLKQSSGTEIHHYLENCTCDPLKYTMGRPVLIVSMSMGKSFRISAS